MMSHARIERVTGMSDALSGLASRTPFKPHRWLRPDAPDMLAALVNQRLEQGIGGSGSQAWSASMGPDVTAVAVLHPLAWDTSVLGMSAARIELVAAGNYAERRTALDAVLQPALCAAKGARIRHVSVRIDAGDDAGIHELERHGFLNVDALATFGLRLDPAAAPAAEHGVRVRPVAAADVQAVGDIAAMAFRDGRFHADPDISAEAGRHVYRSWAIACCEGAAADTVLVATGPEGVRGFVACRMQPDTAVHLQRPAGTIIMIATAAPARGRGVGRDLIAAAVAWFIERNAVAVEVGTQLRNVAAARLYERFGFRLVDGALSFRAMLDK
jgi:ribosomal protein S18 acetylase RimI-like enzyme